MFIISGKFELSREYPDYFKYLSRWWYTLLRDLKVRKATTRKILESFYGSLPDTDDNGKQRCSKFSYYIFGSQCEGTSFLEINSDVDRVYVPESLPVVLDISEAQHNSRCFRVVQDPNTPAGYVKLQCVINGNPQYLYTSVQMKRNRCLSPIYRIDYRNRKVLTLSHRKLLCMVLPEQMKQQTLWLLVIM